MPAGNGKRTDPVIVAIGACLNRPGDASGRACHTIELTLSCGHVVTEYVYPNKFRQGWYKSIVVGKHRRCWPCQHARWEAAGFFADSARVP
jgi:hypothetical protein